MSLRKFFKEAAQWRITGGHARDHAAMGFFLGSMTFAQLLSNYPAASTPVGALARINDFGALWLENNGTYWRPINGIANVKTQIADINLSASTSEQIFAATQITFPANFLRIGCEIEINEAYSKASTTGLATLRHRFGSTGTTTDTQLSSNNSLGNGQMSIGRFMVYKVIGSTTLRRGGADDVNYPYAATAATLAADITIPDISGALVLSATGQMSATSPLLSQKTYNVQIIFP